MSEEKSAILVDIDKCIGCSVCVVGCQQSHSVGEKKRIQVNAVGPQRIDGRLKTAYFPLMTEHCIFGQTEAEPDCVAVCPVDALICCDETETIGYLSGKYPSRYQVCKVA